ncbi:invasion protein, partial [Methylobacterium radiotolerans]
MPTFRALLRLSLIATSLTAVPILAARAQDAEPAAAPA